MKLRVVGLLRATHFLPTLTVTSLTYVLAWRTSDITTALGIAVTVFSGQLIVGWSNDYLDYSDDLAHARNNKPLVANLISLRTLQVAIPLAGLALVILTLFGPLGGRYGFAHILAVASAVSYNLKLKTTVLSFLPYAFAFGLLPVIVLGATGYGSELWMAVVGALFGVGVHLANVFKDLEEDRDSGIYGLPQILGVMYSRIVCALAFGVSGLILYLNTEQSDALLVVLASLIFLVPLPRKLMFPFAMILGLAVMAVLVTSITI